MPREGWHYLVKKNATVFDTIGLIITFVRKFPFQSSVTKAIRASHAPDKISFLRKLFDYVCRNTRYLKDTIGKEKIYTPDRAMREGHIGIDCKKYATFLGAALHRTGIKHYYKVISYDGSSYEHVYVIVPLKGGGYITLDPVNDCKFNEELQHKKAMLYDINGKPVELHALGKNGNLGQPGTAAWDAFYNSRTWENYYRPGYGPVGSRGSGVENANLGWLPKWTGRHGRFSDGSPACEYSTPYGNFWNDCTKPSAPPKDTRGLTVDPSGFAPLRQTTTRAPRAFTRRSQGFRDPVNNLNYDLDVLGALFKMGSSDLKKLGRTVPYLLLPIFAEQYNALMRAGNKPTFVIPDDLLRKIGLSKSWIVSKSRQAFHENYWVYIMLGFSEAIGEPPILAIDKMFKSKNIQLSGLGQEEGEAEWRGIEKIARDAWTWVKSLFVTNINQELEDFPESARFTMADWKRMFGVALEPGGGPGNEPPLPQPTHSNISAPIVYVAQRSPGSDEIFFRTRGYVPVTKGETFTVEETPGYNGVYVALDSKQTTASNVPGQQVFVKGTINQNSPTYKFAGDRHQDIIESGTVLDGVKASKPSAAGKTTQMLLPLGIFSFLLLR